MTNFVSSLNPLVTKFVSSLNPLVTNFVSSLNPLVTNFVSSLNPLVTNFVSSLNLLVPHFVSVTKSQCPVDALYTIEGKRMCGHEGCWHVFKNRNYDRHFRDNHEELYLTEAVYEKDKDEIDKKIQQA